MVKLERQSEVTLSGTGAIKVFKAGHKAMSEIKGLRGLVFRALLLNYLIELDGVGETQINSLESVAPI